MSETLLSPKELLSTVARWRRLLLEMRLEFGERDAAYRAHEQLLDELERAQVEAQRNEQRFLSEGKGAPWK